MSGHPCKDQESYSLQILYLLDFGTVGELDIDSESGLQTQPIIRKNSNVYMSQYFTAHRTQICQLFHINRDHLSQFQLCMSLVHKEHTIRNSKKYKLGIHSLTKLMFTIECLYNGEHYANFNY